MNIFQNQKFIDPRYRAEIDGLRALAVLLVLFYHAFPAIIPAGFIGVDIFFVISGYLITSLLLNDISNGHFSLANFYYRRIKRIFPALLLVLICCMCIGWYVMYPHEYKLLNRHILAGTVFLSNIQFLSEINYFDSAAQAKPLLNLWSLGIEEQYYIVWPIILIIIAQSTSIFKIKYAVYAMILLSITSFGLNLHYSYSNISIAFYSPLTRFWELAVGGLLSVAITKYNLNTCSKFKNITPVIGIFIIFTYALFGSKNNIFPGYFVLVPVIGSALILSSSTKSFFVRHVLSHPFLVKIGLISYPLYLWHWPLLSFLKIVESDTPSNIQLFTVIVLSVTLAWLTYTFVELPLKNARLSLKNISKYLLIIAGILAFFSYFSFKQNGFPDRPSMQNKVATLFTNSPHIPLRNADCNALNPILSSFDTCVLSKPREPEVLILGDSHSHVLYNSFAKYLSNSTVMNIGKFHCLPFYSKNSLNTYNCGTITNDLLNFLNSKSSIQKIYITGYWNYLSTGVFTSQGINYRIPSIASIDELNFFSETSHILLTELFKRNTEVILILDPPALDFDIKTCFNSRPFTLSGTIRKNCNISRKQYDDSRLAINFTLEELQSKYPKLKIYDPAPVFCSDSYCGAIKDDLPLYFDGDHLHSYGADLLVADLINATKVNK